MDIKCTRGTKKELCKYSFSLKLPIEHKIHKSLILFAFPHDQSKASSESYTDSIPVQALLRIPASCLAYRATEKEATA